MPYEDFFLEPATLAKRKILFCSLLVSLTLINNLSALRMHAFYLW